MWLCNLLFLLVSIHILLASSNVLFASARQLDKCELARKLHVQHYLTVDQVQIWVCIAIHQSRMQVDAANYDPDGTGYHGLYQISSRYWCGPENACALDCARLRNDDLSDDLACMSLIFAEHQRISGNGYHAWNASYARHCAAPRLHVVDECFGEVEEDSNDVVNGQQQTTTTATTTTTTTSINDIANKVYARCELARELRYVHGLPADQIATWVCIAKHESNYRTSVVGRLNADGSGDHGLFQISDLYWCSLPSAASRGNDIGGGGGGGACGLSCAQLTDSDITDDVQCIRTIHAEHQRLSGNGFTAWAVYRPHCSGFEVPRFVDGCFDDDDNTAPLQTTTKRPTTVSMRPASKVYTRCELAAELRAHRHRIPDGQIATWVCIAEHESRLDTAAVGRLNWDGSADYGLFQISDLYWCTTRSGRIGACDLPCDRLLDADITDDIRCIRQIHEEHERLSGDGFNAWAVYQPYCHGAAAAVARYVDGCAATTTTTAAHRNGIEDDDAIDKVKAKVVVAKATKPKRTKVYERCELAHELHGRHGIRQLEQVATWVCIAYHESRFNTSAVGRLNGDSSADHGLFQISDIYWCSVNGRNVGPAACGLSCDQLEDDDITDDVRCIRTIYEEHQRLSGDGFNAWAVYPLYCKRKATIVAEYVNDCFDGSDEKTTTTTTTTTTQSTTTRKPVEVTSTKKPYVTFVRSSTVRLSSTTTAQPATSPSSSRSPSSTETTTMKPLKSKTTNQTRTSSTVKPSPSRKNTTITSGTSSSPSPSTKTKTTITTPTPTKTTTMKPLKSKTTAHQTSTKAPKTSSSTTAKSPSQKPTTIIINRTKSTINPFGVYLNQFTTKQPIIDAKRPKTDTAPATVYAATSRSPATPTTDAPSASTQRPMTDVYSAQAISDKQAANKASFDRLYEMYKRRQY